MTPRAPRCAGWLAATLVALVALAAPMAALAQEPPPVETTVTMQPPEARLGDLVRITVDVRHPQDVLVTASEPVTVEDIELVRRDPDTTEVSPVSGLATTTFTFVVAAYDLGSLQPGEVAVAWLREDGTSGEVVVQPPAIEVVAVRAADDAALRPLKPQATVGGAPPGWVRPLAIGGVAAGALLLGLAGWLFMRRRDHEPEPMAVPASETPEEVARRRLDVIAAEGPARWREYGAYYGAISLVVREYLEARFDFRATALTTAELERRMGAAGVGRWQARLVSGLLARCDAAVYAGVYPDPASADHDLTLAYEIVELSRPRSMAAEAVPA